MASSVFSYFHDLHVIYRNGANEWITSTNGLRYSTKLQIKSVSCIVHLVRVTVCTHVFLCGGETLVNFRSLLHAAVGPHCKKVLLGGRIRWFYRGNEKNHIDLVD